MNSNPLANPNLYFDSGVESSYSSSEGSVDTADNLFGDKERDDGGVDEVSKRGLSSENILCNASGSSREYNAGSDVSTPGNTTSTDRSLAQKAFSSSMLDPEVGMVFHSEEQAYAYYNTYAKRKGFSVRRGHLGRRKDGSVRVRIYLCSYEGTRQKHCTHNTKKPRPVVRTDCMARIEYKVTRENVWIVSKVIYEHNHPLIRSSKAHLLRSHRKMLASQYGAETEMADLEVRPAETHGVQTEQAHETDSFGFLLRDQSSYLHTNRMRELEKGDAQVLLDFLKTKQLEDPSFFYAIQLDDKEQVTNIFWADPRSMIDYAYFGDVVLLDTTYQGSKNDIPIALFIGINHHKQAVVFGAALLLDETTESFVWLFRTFMSAMSGKPPRTIFTDKCDAIMMAVSMTYPETFNRVCLWQILQSVAKHISHLYTSESNFQKDFKNCIYEGSCEDDFLARWVNLVNKYDLSNNPYLEDLYASREKWSLVYCKNVFSASMTTIEWSENMKKHFKKHFNRKLPLSKFIDNYHNVLYQFRKKELYEDYRSRQTKPVLLVDMPMLNEAAESYTRLIYKDFEDEFKGQLSCLCEPVALDGSTLTFKVMLPEKGCYGLVEFNPTNYTVTCSCKKFESIGILCMHVLKVLNNNNILDLPSHYILKRWTKYANDGMASNRHQSVVEAFGRDQLMSRFSRVCHKAITIAAKSAFSKDAIDMFDDELNKMMTAVENIVCNAPMSKESEDADVVNCLQQDTTDAGKKRRGGKGLSKGIFDRKRKPKAQPMCNSSDIVMRHHPSQRQTNDAPAHMMVEEPSHIPAYHLEGETVYSNRIPMPPSGLPGCNSFPPETAMPSQESFTPSQSLFDHAMASQGVGSPNLAWSAPRGSANVPIPVMQGQTNNFLNWTVQAYNIPSIALSQHQLEQTMHSTVQSHHQTLPCKLNFDINKGN
ncbi:protein FAR1-RELATED SEQUENCE 5-like isoform X1 [Iris pallida]|uniref:Protein FAR1-RELATED SEQUENCE 5-like isoform X1 n=1 Tax=Iris pallida TaxID=29817 RepID=A0AAX6G0X8_IRIPA|nr:protein FAR1-RELATED SEQUENCE 5-like isoform X1 [Iris pallida]KAJ6822344.1 protein FAR1-RELATED SEQUENCE 5-like isoform X1 [Iris pallida]